MDDDLTVAVDPEGTATRVSAAGDLSALNCHHLSSAVSELVSAGVRDVRLDLAAVAFMDSSGVQCLVNVKRTMDEAGGALGIVAMNERVERILSITGLLPVFTPAPPWP